MHKEPYVLPGGRFALLQVETGQQQSNLHSQLQLLSICMDVLKGKQLRAELDEDLFQQQSLQQYTESQKLYLTNEIKVSAAKKCQKIDIIHDLTDV